MARTLVGLFDDESAAQSAARDLMNHGFTADDISIVTNATTDTDAGGGQIAAQGQPSISGNLPGGAQAGIVSALTQAGVSQADADHYAEAVRRGGALVTVDSDDAGYDKVQPIFDRNHSVDIGERADYHRESGYAKHDENAPPYTPEQVSADRQNLRLYGEKLTARKENFQAGEVTLHKEVITENKTIDVPVTREEAVIERRQVGGGDVADADFRDETIRVPLMEEKVTLEKTPVVTGEVSVGKREVTETQHLSDTVRREEAHLENPDNLDVADRADQNEMLDEEEAEVDAEPASRRAAF